MQKSTLKSLAAVASKDLTRPALCSVQIKYGTDSATLTATDGHVLMQAVTPLDREQEPNLPPDATVLLIPAESIQQAVKLCPGVKDSPDRIRIDADNLVSDGISMLPYRPIASPYPNTEKVWPDPEREEVEITLNARLLKKLCEAAIAQDKQYPYITLAVPEPNTAGTTHRRYQNDAAVFKLNRANARESGTDTNITGLIMPMRR